MSDVSIMMQILFFLLIPNHIFKVVEFDHFRMQAGPITH